ncbi:MAG: hypothetical protein ACP5QA_11720 [Phycisphaerae bacterium]
MSLEQMSSQEAIGYNRPNRPQGAPQAGFMRAWGAAALVLCAAASMGAGAVDAAPMMGLSSPDLGTINVELGGGGKYTGTGAAPDTGTYWNQVVYTGPYALKNSAGAATNVTYSDTTNSSYSGTSNNTPSNNPLLNNYIYVHNGTANFTLGGLTAGDRYDLYLYGTNGQPTSPNAAQPSTFTIGATSLATTAGTSSATATSIPTSDEGISYVEFTNLAPVFNATNNDYEINGAWKNVPGVSYNGYGVFNGLQLVSVAVPESTPLVLMTVGVLGMTILLPRRPRCNGGHAA